MEAPHHDQPAGAGPAGTADPAGGEGAAAAGARLGPGFWLSVIWIATTVGLALLAGLLPLQDPLQPDPINARAGPSGEHWMGTDTLGRDVFSRVVFGSRVSLAVAALSSSLAAVVGGVLGLYAGFYRGRTETWIMGAMDVMLAFPALILALALTTFLGANFRNVALAIALIAVPIFARVARAQTLTFAERDFVLVARAMGAKSSRILFRDVAPNVLPTVVAFTLVIAGVVIVVEGSLSYLGLGVPPPSPTWGGMISAGQGDLGRSPHISLFPGLVMFLTVLAMNTAGEGLRARHERLVGAL